MQTFIDSWLKIKIRLVPSLLMNPADAVSDNELKNSLFMYIIILFFFVIYFSIILQFTIVEQFFQKSRSNWSSKNSECKMHFFLATYSFQGLLNHIQNLFIPIGIFFVGSLETILLDVNSFVKVEANVSWDLSPSQKKLSNICWWILRYIMMVRTSIMLRIPLQQDF